MKEKILAFLKTKLTGVQEMYLSVIAEEYAKTITKDEDIETTLTPILPVITLSAKQLQVEGDRRATDAAKTAVKTFTEKHGLDDNGKPINQTSQNNNQSSQSSSNEMPPWLKEFQETVTKETAALKAKLEAMEKEKTQTVLSAKAKDKLAEKGIPEWFYSPIIRNLDIASEDKIDQLVIDLDRDYATTRQKLAEEGVVVAPPPSSQGQGEKGDAVAAESLAKRRNAATSEGVTAKKIV